MPRLTDELVPLAAVNPPTIMDGPHTWHLCAACSHVEAADVYHCEHCDEVRVESGKVEAV